ncbi:HAMP domain-containing protein [Streptomyces sp. M10(2022)]
MLLFLNRADSSVVVPEQITNDQRERTDTLADRVRRALNEGHADLVSVASLIGDKTSPDDIEKVLERTRTEHLRYRSLYVRTADGTIIAQAGDSPGTGRRVRWEEGDQNGTAPFAEPISLLNHSGKEPVIAGYAELPGRDGAAVVGEFRVDFINSLLKRPGLGQIRVVDGERRVLGQQRLPGLREAAGPAGRTRSRYEPEDRPHRPRRRSPLPLRRSGAGSGRRTVRGRRRGQVAQLDGGQLEARGRARDPRVPPAEPHRPGRSARRHGRGRLSRLAAHRGRTPLRALASQAEALADGDRRTVLYPRHHDEVGAVARSLELLRQQVQDQRRRDTAPTAPAGRN